jgi:hypothetical protein
MHELLEVKLSLYLEVITYIAPSNVLTIVTPSNLNVAQFFSWVHSFK